MISFIISYCIAIAILSVALQLSPVEMLIMAIVMAAMFAFGASSRRW